MGIRCGLYFTRFGVEFFVHQGVADTFPNVEFLDAIFFGKLKTSIVMSRVIFGDSRRHAMVKDNADLIGVINFFRAHFMERIKEIRCIDVVDHEKIRMGHNNIARFDFFHTGIFAEDLFRQSKAFAAQGSVTHDRKFRRFVACFDLCLRIFHETAVFDDFEKILRNGANREGFAICRNRLVFKIDGHNVTAFHNLLNPVALQKNDAVIEGVAEEDTGKALCDDAAHPIVRKNGRSLFPGRSAAKVLARNEDVPRFDGRTEFRLQELKSIAFHFFNGRNRTALARNDGIRIDVIPKSPNLAVKFCIHAASPLPRPRRLP